MKSAKMGKNREYSSLRMVRLSVMYVDFVLVSQKLPKKSSVNILINFIHDIVSKQNRQCNQIECDALFKNSLLLIFFGKK